MVGGRASSGEMTGASEGFESQGACPPKVLIILGLSFYLEIDSEYWTLLRQIPI